MPNLSINGFNAHFLKAGHHGPPVALVHGFSSLNAMWWQQIPALSRAGYQVIAPDLRGHGDSEHPGHGYDPDTLADDLAALLDALNHPRAHLVGLSLGGMVVSRFALRHPGRVLSLTIADSFSAKPPPEVMEIFLEHEAIGRGQGMHELFVHLLHKPALPFGPDYTVPMELFPVMEKAFLKNRLETLSAYLRAFEALPDWTAELAALRCPTLAIVGDVDTPCREPMRRIAAAIPGATLHVIPRCGHSSAVEKAPEFNRLLLDFLDRL